MAGLLNPHDVCTDSQPGIVGKVRDKLAAMHMKEDGFHLLRQCCLRGFFGQRASQPRIKRIILNATGQTRIPPRVIPSKACCIKQSGD